jgi:hypothetical protein
MFITSVMNTSHRRTAACISHPSRTKRTYAAFIYERYNDRGQHHERRVYDLDIVLRKPNGRAIRRRKIECVYELIVTSHKEVPLARLITLMRAKLSHAPRVRAATTIIDNGRVRFTHLVVDLEWLKSVVEVEFDYHVGDRLCRLPNNKLYLEDYISSLFNGYGPMFYDENTRYDVRYESFRRLFEEEY